MSAKTHFQSLLDRGFDLSEVKEGYDEGTCFVRCSECEAVVINGVACHEHGCPNKKLLPRE